MPRRLQGTFALLALITVWTLASGLAKAQSLGRMHVPSTVPQYLGCGFGAGRHAPIVHVPGPPAVRAARRAFAPGYAPPACYAPVGCASGACGIQPPTAIDHGAYAFGAAGGGVMEGPLLQPTPMQPAPVAPLARPPRGLVDPPMPRTTPRASESSPSPNDRSAQRVFFPM